MTKLDHPEQLGINALEHERLGSETSHDPSGSFLNSLVDSQEVFDTEAFNRQIVTEAFSAVLPDNVHWLSETYSLRERSFINPSGIEMERQRLRATWTALMNNHPEAILEPPPSMFATDALARSQRYVFGETMIRGTKYKRDKLLDPGFALGILEDLLRAQNDPVIQILDQITEQYAEQLSTPELRTLKGDVLMATKRPVIRAAYENYIGQLKKWVAAVSN